MQYIPVFMTEKINHSWLVSFVSESETTPPEGKQVFFMCVRCVQHYGVLHPQKDGLLVPSGLCVHVHACACAHNHNLPPKEHYSYSRTHTSAFNQCYYNQKALKSLGTSNGWLSTAGVCAHTHTCVCAWSVPWLSLPRNKLAVAKIVHTFLPFWGSWLQWSRNTSGETTLTTNIRIKSGLDKLEQISRVCSCPSGSMRLSSFSS